MKKYPFLFLVLVILSACLLSPQEPVIDPEQLAAEEQAVYAIFFAGTIPGTTVVIQRSPASFVGDSDESDLTLEYIREQLSDLTDDLLQSYIERNREPVPFDETLEIGVSYYLMSSEEQQALFDREQNGGQDGWELLYGRFRGSPGITELSRVGFNPGMTQALVYVGNQSHGLAGAGIFYLLEKQNGDWVIIEEVMLWIS